MPGTQTDETTKNRIYKELRRSIIMHHRKPGERLLVDELAKLYGTSITPVRDAMQRLDQEGLVTIRPRSGCYVTRLTLKQLNDMLDLRGVLEIAAIERAVPRITEAQLQNLEHVHAGYTGDDDASYERYTEENRSFHYLIAKAAGNEELAETLGRLHDRLERFMILRRGGQSQPHTHARILEALRQRDVASARQAMLDEINETRDAVLDRVMQEDASSWSLGTSNRP